MIDPHVDLGVDVACLITPAITGQFARLTPPTDPTSLGGAS